MAEIAEQQLSDEELDELSVRCLSLQLDGLQLLLPNTMVAEVTESQAVKPAANTPDWLRGFISWRGKSVAVISYEQLLGLDSITMRHPERRMVVLNTLNNNPRIPFVAMEIGGMPHLLQLKHGMLEYYDNGKLAEPVILTALQLEGEAFVVPNLDAIERMLESLGITS